MRFGRTAGTALVTLGILGFASACGDDSGSNSGTTTDSTESPDDDADMDGLSEDAVITYEFRDASVPPEHHRSYTLTISHDEVEVVVDSYGDVIGETTEPIPVDVWDGLSTGVGEVASLETADNDDGCSGGTARSLVIEDGGQTLVDLYLDLCQNELATSQAEVADGYVQPVIDAIPDWDSLFETE